MSGSCEGQVTTKARSLAVLFDFAGAGLWALRSEGEPVELGAAHVLAFCRRHRIEQLWIHPSAEDPARLQPAVASPVGWEVKGSGPWLQYFERRDGYDSEPISIVFPSLDRKNPYWKGATPAELLDALILFERATGIRYRFSPENTSGRLLTWLHRHGARLEPVSMPPPALDVNTETDVHWSRPLGLGESQRRFIAAWDTNAAYLSACSSLALGAGDLRHRTVASGRKWWTMRPGEVVFPGYYLARFPGTFTPMLPSPFGEYVSEPKWVSAPTLELGLELCSHVDVFESWVWLQSRRALEPWYKRLRDARAALQAVVTADSIDGSGRAAALALQALKVAWGPFIGGYVASTGQSQGWDRSADPLFRPDWRHHVMATVRTRQYRTLWKLREAGVYPFAISTDCLYFATDHPEVAPAGLRVGSNPGAYKFAGAVPMRPLDGDDITRSVQLMFREKPDGVTVGPFDCGDPTCPYRHDAHEHDSPSGAPVHALRVRR